MSTPGYADKTPEAVRAEDAEKQVGGRRLD
jgi:hypothetical protein